MSTVGHHQRSNHQRNRQGFKCRFETLEKRELLSLGGTGVDPLPSGDSGLDDSTVSVSGVVMGAAQHPYINPLLSVDMTSAAYLRFKGWVDAAVAGKPGYAFSATDAAIMYRLTGDAKYATLAIAMVEKQVADAEAAIAAGTRPAVAGGMYLKVGNDIGDLSRVYDWMYDRLTQTQRDRWSVYAEQAVWNVWNNKQAKWGTTATPWTGWATNNPGNNYYYSFIEATMTWGLASQNQTWLNYLHNDRLPLVVNYYKNMSGGGSLEGTNYGAAQARLFYIYEVWKQATGEDLSALRMHARDSIEYWIHATVPTLDMFAPIGDQARVAMPLMYDYQRRLVLEAMALNPGTLEAEHGRWWLNNIILPFGTPDRMTNGSNYKYDLLYQPSPQQPQRKPTDLLYEASSVGELFARTSWNTDATWLWFKAGTYNESHGHQDQGSFMLYSGKWLAIDEAIYSNGIQQGTEVHNVVRFEKAGVTIGYPHQNSVSTMTHTDVDGVLTVQADLSAAYTRSAADVRGWQRELVFNRNQNTVRIHDRFDVAAGVNAVWQINVADKPIITGNSIVAGNLQITPITPANSHISVLDWTTITFDSVTTKTYKGGWKVEIRGGQEYDVELRLLNVPPVAANDSYSTTEDTALTVAAASGVLANDTDADGNALTAVLVTGPAHGTLTLNANGSFTYTPAANYNGSDSFVYKANDGTTNSANATVTITVSAVNDAPVAANNSYRTSEDTALTVAAASGVLANDTDVDGNALTAVLVTGPTHGTLTLNANGSFTYTPAANYNGSDSFVYKANDGTANSANATVTISVSAVNDAPVAANNSYSTTEDTALTIAAVSGVLANDSDVDGNALTAVLVTRPAHGSLALNANGGFTYTPAANYNGSDSFTYKANDRTTNSTNATVTISVSAVNDAPVAANNSYSTTEDTALTVAATSGVLANDSDVDGNALTAVLVTGPAHGTLTLNANGSFTYTPTANYVGSDSFVYKTNDGTTNSGQATVTIGVMPTLMIADAISSEGNTDTKNLVFTVTLSHAMPQAVSVLYATANASATAGSDYIAKSGTLIFAAGQTAKTISIAVSGDTTLEWNERFWVNLRGATGATITKAKGQGSILNDDTPALYIGNVTRAEGNGGTTDAILTVTLSRPTTRTVTVNYATANGSAVAGSDYVAQSGALIFQPGQLTATIAVPVTGDAIWEPNEAFYVNLSRAVGATIADSQGRATILNDDPVASQTVPYSQTFAIKPLGDAGWEYYSTKQGRIAVVNGQLRMDDAVSDTVYSLNEAVLHVNLANQTNVQLSLDHILAGDERHTYAGSQFTGHVNADLIAVSVDGATWVKVADLAGSFTQKAFLLDSYVDAAATAAGSSDRSDVRIKFQQYDNGVWSADGRAFDNIGVTSSRIAALMAAEAGPTGRQGPSPLNAANLALMADAAIAQWANAGLDNATIARLRQTQVVASDLPDTQIGFAAADKVYIDTDAAGHGWFLDSTPLSDEEFIRSNAGDELLARDPRAVDHMDLLTVLAHEFGHVAGLPDISPNAHGLMGATLMTGARRTARK